MIYIFMGYSSVVEHVTRIYQAPGFPLQHTHIHNRGCAGGNTVTEITSAQMRRPAFRLPGSEYKLGMVVCASNPGAGKTKRQEGPWLLLASNSERVRDCWVQ